MRSARKGYFFRIIGIGLFMLATQACRTNSTNDEPVSNKALFTLDCDLNGANGVLTMQAELVANTGITWGSGSNPDITGVIATGDYTMYTSGDLRSTVAYYTFTGEDSFADFVNHGNYNRFLVQWQDMENGIIMNVNPFGPGPTQHTCVLTSSSYVE